MKKFIFFAIFGAILLASLYHDYHSRAEQTDDPSGKVILQLSKPDGQDYVVYKIVEDTVTVTRVSGILQHVPWENAKVSMSRQPDYKIQPVRIDLTVSSEPVIYDVWLSPDKDVLEVVIEGVSNYGRVSTANTIKLLSVLGTP